MWFIIKVKIYDEIDFNSHEESMIAYAPTFTEAIKQIEKYYDNTLEAILNMEPITNNPILLIDEVVAAHIKDIPCNDF